LEFGSLGASGSPIGNWRTWKRWRRNGNAGTFLGREIDRTNYPILFQIVTIGQLLGIVGALFGALAGFFFLGPTLGIE
jgi:hypothetical protein